MEGSPRWAAIACPHVAAAMRAINFGIIGGAVHGMRFAFLLGSLAVPIGFAWVFWTGAVLQTAGGAWLRSSMCALGVLLPLCNILRGSARLPTRSTSSYTRLYSSAVARRLKVNLFPNFTLECTNLGYIGAVPTNSLGVLRAPPMPFYFSAWIIQSPWGTVTGRVFQKLHSVAGLRLELGSIPISTSREV